MGGAHSSTATTRDRLDHHRVTDFSCDLCRLFIVCDDAVTSRRDRHTRFASARAGHVFVAHLLNHVGRRPDKFDFATFDHFREMRVLGQKTVAGMNRIDIADLGRAHDPVDFQITFRAWRGADANRFVRELDVQ